MYMYCIFSVQLAVYSIYCTFFASSQDFYCSSRSLNFGNHIIFFPSSSDIKVTKIKKKCVPFSYTKYKEGHNHNQFFFGAAATVYLFALSSVFVVTGGVCGAYKKHTHTQSHTNSAVKRTHTTEKVTSFIFLGIQQEYYFCVKTKTRKRDAIN